MDQTQISTTENERLIRLQEDRKIAQENELTEETSVSETAKSSLAGKLGQNWLILLGAAFFDLLGLIPGLCVIFNFIFGAILYFKFGSKKISKTIITISGGSIADFLIGIIPVNLAAAVVRIIDSD